VTTKTGDDGPRGVGLALVARAAARLGGRVEVDDAEARLGGALVRVVLPADPARPADDVGADSPARAREVRA
jgi:two-component system CitB family sensor kinase